MTTTALTSLEPTPFTKADGRRFAFPVGGAFAGLAALALWQGNSTVALLGAVAAGALWLLGALVPAKLGPLFRAWMTGAHLLSKVTTPIFLLALWLVVITPSALLGRLLGHRPITHRAQGDSYWQARPPERRRSELTRQF